MWTLSFTNIEDWSSDTRESSKSCPLIFYNPQNLLLHRSAISHTPPETRILEIVKGKVEGPCVKTKTLF